jgi:hypothetical protein
MRTHLATHSYFAIQLGLLGHRRPLPQGVVNVGVGFGDGIVHGASFGILNLQQLRNLYNGGDGGADICSSQYKNAFGGGAAFRLGITTGGITKLALSFAAVESFAQASYLSFQLWSGAIDVTGSLEEVAPYSEQFLQKELESIYDINKEAVDAIYGMRPVR